MDREVIEALPMPATYGRHLARLFDADALLAGTGLRVADLDDPARRITVRQALQYVRNTLTLATTPDWYLGWAATLTDHFHGPISIALLSAPNFGAGIDVFLRYFSSRIPYMHLQGHSDGSHFFAELCPLLDLAETAPLLIETPLIIVHQHLATVYGVDLGEARLDLAYAATPYADTYARYFECPVRFNAPRNALVVPAAWRELRNIGYSESTWAHAVQQCAATAASSRERETLAAVRHCLYTAFEDKHRQRPLPTLAEVSEELHLAPRTLIRRLRSFGTTYQALTDDFLRMRAQELLANDGIAIKEVAGMLGFDNPANFGKAFKRWCGVSPGQYRAARSREL